MKQVSITTLLISIIFTLLSCNTSAQPELDARDNPVVPLDSFLVSFLGDTSLVHLLMTADTVDAFRFKLGELDDTTVLDTSKTVLSSFYVLRKHSNLSTTEVSTLKSILKNPKSYSLTGYLNRCGFEPDIAFRFKSNNTTLVIGVNSRNECADIEFHLQKEGTTIVKKKECSKEGRAKFFQLAKDLFPIDYMSISQSNINPRDNNKKETKKEEKKEVKKEAKKVELFKEEPNYYKTPIKGMNLKQVVENTNLDKKMLKELNPKIKKSKWKNLPKGTKIITSKNKKIRIVAESATWKDLATQLEIKDEDLKNSNPKLKRKQKLTKDMVVNLPIK